MPASVTVPRLGWTMEEGTFVEWLARDGDHITVGQALFILESDKSSETIEATPACCACCPTAPSRATP